VEQFIDTPVKHYSSGMYLRLAFAVAAHLEPEILIVDEVLAVGDVEFQKKCLGKMSDVAKEGRTIFFVSHNMPAIMRLCERVIYMDEGKLGLDGTAHEVIKAYLHSGLGTMSSREWLDPDRAPRGEVARLWAVRIRTEDGECMDKIDIRKPVGLEMEYEVLKPGYKLRSALRLLNEDAVHIFEALEGDTAWRGRVRPLGRYRSTAWIPGNFLAEGTMIVDVGLHTVEPSIEQFIERQAVAFHVVDSCDGDSARGDYAGPFPGVVRPLLRWNTVMNSDATERER
jgi:lipopolysaccharide transport system ATP-binding protein